MLYTSTTLLFNEKYIYLWSVKVFGLFKVFNLDGSEGSPCILFPLFPMFEIESISHILMQCPAMEAQRSDMYNTLYSLDARIKPQMKLGLNHKWS